MTMRLILCCAVVGAVRRRADCTPATCVGDDDTKYDRDLFREATVARRLTAPTTAQQRMSLMVMGCSWAAPIDGIDGALHRRRVLRLPDGRRRVLAAWNCAQEPPSVNLVCQTRDARK